MVNKHNFLLTTQQIFGIFLKIRLSAQRFLTKFTRNSQIDVIICKNEQNQNKNKDFICSERQFYYYEKLQALQE